MYLVALDERFTEEQGSGPTFRPGTAERFIQLFPTLDWKIIRRAARYGSRLSAADRYALKTNGRNCSNRFWLSMNSPTQKKPVSKT